MGWQLIESRQDSSLDSEFQGVLAFGYKQVWFRVGLWWTALFRLTNSQLCCQLDLAWHNFEKRRYEHKCSDFFLVTRKETTLFEDIVKQKQQLYGYEYGKCITLAVGHVAKEFTLDELVNRCPEMSEET